MCAHLVSQTALEETMHLKTVLSSGSDSIRGDDAPENCTIIWLRFVLFYTSACKWTTRINAEKTVLSSGSASSCSIHLPANGRPESMPRKLYYHLAPLRLVLYICLQMDDQNQCRESHGETLTQGEDSLTSRKLPTD